MSRYVSIACYELPDETIDNIVNEICNHTDYRTGYIFLFDRNLNGYPFIGINKEAKVISVYNYDLNNTSPFEDEVRLDWRDLSA